MNQNSKKIALNYIYLSKQHAGGKDQVALNLLEGFHRNGDCGQLIVFCYDYLVPVIESIAPDVQIEAIPYSGGDSELSRLWQIMWTNTKLIPKLIQKHNISAIFHASCTNGLAHFRVPSIVIPHDIKAVSHKNMGYIKIPWWKYIMYRCMYYIDFKHADYVIAISDTDRQEIVTYYPKFADKVVRIYNPVKVEVQESKIPVKARTDVSAINLQFHHKNILTLIKAFELAKDQIDGNLVLVGNVPKRVEYLKQYVKDHHLENRVMFTGFLSGKQKREVLLNSALYVNCSMFEGFGMTAVEAMILKVPTLVSKISANYEVTQGLCRYYHPVDDERALADAMIKAIRTPDSRQELSEKSDQMLETYDYRKIAAEYMKLFTRGEITHCTESYTETK